MLLEDIKGVSLGETTLEILNLSGFYTVADVRKKESRNDYKGKIQSQINAKIQNQQLNLPIRAPSYWKSLQTRCETVILKIQKGSAFPIDPIEFCCILTGFQLFGLCI